MVILQDDNVKIHQAQIVRSMKNRFHRSVWDWRSSTSWCKLMLWCYFHLDVHECLIKVWTWWNTLLEEMVPSPASYMELQNGSI